MNGIYEKDFFPKNEKKNDIGNIKSIKMIFLAKLAKDKFIYQLGSYDEFSLYNLAIVS